VSRPASHLSQGTVPVNEGAPGQGLTALADLFAQRADPYPAYAQLRRTAPAWEPIPGLRVLSRHHDCAAVLRDTRFGHTEGDEIVTRPNRRAAPVGATGHDRPPVRSFLGLNPPDHTRLRRLVARSFTPRRVEDLLPRMEEITAGLLEAVRGQEVVDVVEALASPLPVGVISELLGIPEPDRPRLVEWSHALAKSIEPAFLISESDRERQVRARNEFGAYLSGLIAERRARPGPDLVSDLVSTRDRDESLTEVELIATCILLLIAGHETTTSLIGNGMLALLRHPDQLARLRASPELAGGAVEELLRYDSPVQLTMRTVLDDATAGGVEVGKGSFLLVLLGSANRDPDAHPQPDRLDIERPPTPHLAFGQGIHFCLGAPLARLEAQVALRALSRTGAMELAEDPEWKDNVVLRGVRRLAVQMSWEPGERAA
jgi:cytochrome P450